MNRTPKKIALITGITGQDGAYLAELLLNKGYEVHGIQRRTSLLNTDRIDHLIYNHDLSLHYGDMTDASSLINIVQQTQPDEMYIFRHRSPSCWRSRLGSLANCSARLRSSITGISVRHQQSGKFCPCHRTR